MSDLTLFFIYTAFSRAFLCTFHHLLRLLRYANLALACEKLAEKVFLREIILLC